MDKYFRLSCSGGDADGWLVSDGNLEDEIAATLESWAQDDLGAWGYGDQHRRGDPVHAIGVRDGVDLDDPAPGDNETHDGEGPPAHRDDHPG